MSRQNPILPGLETLWNSQIKLIRALIAREKFKNGDIIFDLRLGYQMDRNSKLSLIVNNLFNREYMSRPADMQPQRTIALQLSLKI